MASLRGPQSWLPALTSRREPLSCVRRPPRHDFPLWLPVVACLCLRPSTRVVLSRSCSSAVRAAAPKRAPSDGAIFMWVAGLTALCRAPRGPVHAVLVRAVPSPSHIPTVASCDRCPISSHATIACAAPTCVCRRGAPTPMYHMQCLYTAALCVVMLRALLVRVICGHLAAVPVLQPYGRP